MVSKGVPKMHQKSLKINPGTFQGPPVCIRDPLDCKMMPKWCPRASQMTQNAHLGTLKGTQNSAKSNNQVYKTQIYIFHFLIDFNPGNQFFYSCQSLQSANQQATGYQRGRRQGRSLKIRRTSAEVAGRARRVGTILSMILC